MNKKIITILGKENINVVEAGANDFFHFMKGKDPKVLFKKLVKESIRQYGNDPYNGKVGTKSGFTLSSQGPVTLKEAQKIAQRSNVDKYDDAIAIAIVASGKPKQKPFKKNYKAFTKEDAIEMAEKDLDSKIKAKGFDWEWKTRDVNILKPRKANLKSMGTKDEVIINPDKSRSVEVKRSMQSKEIQDTMEKIVNEHPDNKKIIVTTLKKEAFEVKYFKAPALFNVSGVIEYSKGKKNIIGYVFFGWAPS